METLFKVHLTHHNQLLKEKSKHYTNMTNAAGQYGTSSIQTNSNLATYNLFPNKFYL